MKYALLRRLGACSVIATLIVATSAAPARAADGETPSAAGSTLLTSGQQQVRQLALSDAAQATAQTPVREGADTTAFFRTPKGVAVLVLVGVGTAYMFYSKIHDRVKSPIRE